MNPIPLLFLFLFLGFLPGGPTAAPASRPPARDAPIPDDLAGVPGSTMRDMIERYETDRAALLRYHDTALSAARRERLQSFHEAWRGHLERVDFDSLGQGERIDYLLLADRIEYELRRLDLEREAFEEAAPLLPFAQAIIDLEEARRRMEPIVPEEAADALDQLARRIGETRKEIEAGLAEDAEERFEVKKTVANRAAGWVDDLRRTLSHWFRYYDGYDPLFSWWGRQPYGEVDRALEGYASFVRERLVGLKDGQEDAILGDPIGREALVIELAHERIPYTPEELVALAEREFSWCEVEMKRAAADLGFGEDWSRALEHVKGLHVEPGRQPELVRELAMEAIAFLDERDLVTIPELCREVWRSEMLSPEEQKFAPFFLGGEVIRIAYPTDSMSHERKLMSLRGNNIHFARATVHHELIPGHHLQGFMAERHATHRRLFRTPFFTEGWALYWELLLWDLGFPRTPEDRVGMLFWRSHRCARIIASLGFHLETMKPEEMIDFLVERVGHERDGATAEVRRWVGGRYGPLYQCAYMLGGLQLRALRKELVGSGRMRDREFHDAILRENAIPIELVRASLTGAELTRDFPSTWRFE